jgi:hypothetical protein
MMLVAAEHLVLLGEVGEDGFSMAEKMDRGRVVCGAAYTLPLHP